jgi:hypothetical protein
MIVVGEGWDFLLENTVSSPAKASPYSYGLEFATPTL